MALESFLALRNWGTATDDALLMERAVRKAALSTPFIRVIDGIQATKYLAGEGDYSDRQRYPVPTLLLLDIKMPKMSGLDVLEWKRSRPESKDLATVIMSSSTEDCDRKEASRLGAKEYLVKPSTLDGLIKQVEKLQAEWLSS